MYVVIKPKPGSCRCVVDLFLILNRADAFVVISSYIQNVFFICLFVILVRIYCRLHFDDSENQNAKITYNRS